MRFKEAYDGWTNGGLTQSEAALLLGQCDRSFRPDIERYEADGMQGRECTANMTSMCRLRVKEWTCPGLTDSFVALRRHDGSYHLGFSVFV